MAKVNSNIPHACFTLKAENLESAGLSIEINQHTGDVNIIAPFSEACIFNSDFCRDLEREIGDHEANMLLDSAGHMIQWGQVMAKLKKAMR